MNEAPTHSRAQARERAAGAVIKAVRWRKRRRRAAGSVATMLLGAVVVLTARYANQPILPPSPIAEQQTAPGPRPIVGPVPFAEVQIATLTGPAPEIKILSAIEPPRIDIIGDTELLDALAAGGRPSGLARINGRTLIVPHAQPDFASP